MIMHQFDDIQREFYPEGRLPHIPASRSTGYVFWTHGAWSYHGALASLPGLSADCGESMTLASKHTIGGIHLYGGIYSSHALAPVGSSINICSAVALAGNTIRLKASNSVACIGSILCQPMIIDDEIYSYTHRYLLSAGLSDMDRPADSMLYLDRISAITGGKLDVALGDDYGHIFRSYRQSIDSIMTQVSSGSGPIYVYAKSDNFDFASDDESHNTASEGCVLMLRGGESDGVTTIVDKSPSVRTIVSSNVEYSTDINVLGSSCLKLLSESAYVDIDNTDDGLMLTGDFTIRLIAQLDNLSTSQAHRLFYFDASNYIDLYAPARITGYICGKAIDVTDPYSDLSRPTMISIGRSGGLIRILTNRRQLVSIFSTSPFGGSSSLSSDITTGGTTFVTPGDTALAQIDLRGLFDDITVYYGWVTDGNSAPQYCGYEFTVPKIIRGYGLLANNGSSHYTTSTNTPTAWLFQGSNDGSNWDTLDQQYSQSIYGGSVYNYRIANNASYLSYRFVFLATPDPDNKVSISSAYFYAANMESTNTEFRIGSDNSATVPGVSGYIMDFQVNTIDICDDTFAGLPVISSPPTQLSRHSHITLVDGDVDIFKFIWNPTVDASADVAGGTNILVGDDSFWDPSATSGWIEIDASVGDLALGCSSYDIGIPSGDITIAPTDWTLSGYADAAWVTIDSQSSITDWTDGEKKRFTVYHSSKEFSKFKVTVSGVNGGSTVKLSRVIVRDRFKSKADTSYSTPTSFAPDMCTVRHNEMHLSANQEWTIVSDTESSIYSSTMVALPPASSDLVVIDNSGRPANANALVTVPVSWASPYQLLDTLGTEIPYIFVNSSLVTSETVASNVLLRMSLKADEIVELSVNTGSAPSSFLSESDVFAVSSGTIDDGYNDINLSTVTVDYDDVLLVDNNLASAYVLPLSSDCSYSPLTYSTAHTAFKSVNLGLSDGGIFISGGGDSSTRILYVNEPYMCELPACSVSHTGAAGTSWSVASIEYAGVWVSNELYVYNFGTRSWTNPVVTGNTGQSATYGFGYAGSGSTLYMYGGRDGSNNLYSQLCTLDASANTLSVETLSGTVPPAMSYAAMALISNGQKLVISGGSYETGAVQTADVALVSDQLKITSNSATAHNGNVYRPERIYGDFAIEVSLSDLTTMASSGKMALLDVLVDHSTRVYAGSNGMQWVYWDGASHTATRVATYGAIRISRIDSTLTFQYRDGAGSWTTMGTKVLSAAPVHVALRCVFTGTGQYATFDDFKIDDVIIDDFTGNGIPNQQWIINKDIFADIDRSTDVYVIDTTTFNSTKYTPATTPYGQFTMAVFNDPDYLGGRERVLAYDSEQVIYELNLTNFTWSKLTWAGVSPKSDEHPLFISVPSDGPTAKDKLIVGYGNVVDGTVSCIDVGGCTTNIELSFDSSVPRFVVLSYESGTHFTVAPYVTVYTGNRRIGQAYDIGGQFVCTLNNIETLTSLRIELTYPGSGDQTINITSVRIFDDVRYGRAYVNSVVSFAEGMELIAPASSGNVPTTTLDSTERSTGTVAQKYVVRDTPLHALYLSAGAQSSYPYSIVVSTNDELQKSLSTATIGSIRVLEKGDVRYAFSFDGRITWETFDGSTWSTIDITNLTTFRTSGITKSIMEAADISAKVSSTVDLAVLLNVSTAEEYAWFSTVRIDTDTDGERDISPYDRWLSAVVKDGGSLVSKDHGVSNERVLDAYNRAVGTHPSSTSTVLARDVSIHALSSRYETECAQIMPSTSSYYEPDLMSTSMSLFRSAFAFGSFDSSTEVIRNISMSSVVEESEQELLRRAFGRDGHIVALYGGSSRGQAELMDSASMTINFIPMTADVMGGDGATLANDDNAWLTPGYRNSSVDEWYNSMTKVVYSTAQTYINQRSSVPTTHVTGKGGVSNKTYGWILGGSNQVYSLLKLDYATDTAGMTSVASVDVSGLTDSGIYRTVGCSTLSGHSGIFVLGHEVDGASKVVAVDYSNDTTTRNIRNSPSISGGMSDYKNTQARTMGESSVYLWQNAMSAAGLLKLDLVTDTMMCRPQQVGAGDYGSQHCCSYCGVAI